MIGEVNHKLGDSLHIEFREVEGGPVIYNRYIKCEDWEFDPEGCIAKVAQYLRDSAATPVAEIYENAEKSRIAMTQEAITTKLVAIAEAEAAKKADAEVAENPKEVNEIPQK